MAAFHQYQAEIGLTDPQREKIVAFIDRLTDSGKELETRDRLDLIRLDSTKDPTDTWWEEGFEAGYREAMESMRLFISGFEGAYWKNIGL